MFRPWGTSRPPPVGAGGQGQGRFGGGNGGGNRPVVGEILSMDATTITIKMQDGSSKIVLLSDKTVFNKSTEGSKADLRTGTRIAASGTDNSDGSVTASTVQINPMFGGMGGGKAQNFATTPPNAK